MEERVKNTDTFVFKHSSAISSSVESTSPSSLAKVCGLSGR